MSRQFKVGDIVIIHSHKKPCNRKVEQVYLTGITNPLSNRNTNSVLYGVEGQPLKLHAINLTLVRAVDEPVKPYKGQFEPAILQFCVINEVMEAPAETELKNNVAIKVNKMLDNLPF